MSMQNLVKSRTYRERSQPDARKHLGLLEKHKDYVRRARDFHRKEDAIHKMKEKASFRNPDEFYMKMSHTKVEDGMHRKRAGESLTQDEMRKFKSEDASYVQMKHKQEAKKIAQLRANLHQLDAPLQNRHTIFVDAESEARSINVPRHGATPADIAVAPPMRREKKRRRAEAEVEAEAEGEAWEAGPADADGFNEDAEGEDGWADSSGDAVEWRSAPRLAGLSAKKREKLERARRAQYSELEQREERHAKMGKTLQRLGIEKALMGKGARKKLKSKGGAQEGAPKVFKWKPRRKT